MITNLYVGTQLKLDLPWCFRATQHFSSLFIQLLQAETREAAVRVHHPFIAITVFMDTGSNFYTNLSSQLAVKLKPLQNQTNPSAQI